MAKNQVQIDIIIDDKGTTKRVTVDADKLGIALEKSAKASSKGAKNTDKLSKSTKDLDRNMRGTAKMSGNQTKEFSKMSQGMGGLVGAYATLAAQVFAVSAAFQFLQGASNMKNLINGQEALGAMTGTAYKTITNNIIAATDAQIKYGDAAKAAAIGTAAGLTAGQLTRLGEVAKNASFALGRDLTDSFNRLVRGVTKAEPELLDELGIILRLDTATRKYAESIGESADSLTAFQRSQAVANEVLEQGENKFAAINHMMSADAANLAQFTKSFDDLFNTIKVTVIEGLNPVLKFLSGNTMALVAAMGLFAIPIVKSILPNLHNWRETQLKVFKEHEENSATYKQNIMDQSSAIKQLSGDQAELGTEAEKAAKRTGKDTTKGGVGYVTGGIKGGASAQARNAAKKGLKQAENDLKKHGIVMNGIFKGYTAKEVAIARASYNERSGLAKTHTNTVVTWFKSMAARLGIVNNKIKIGWAKTMTVMTGMAVVASKGINLIMSAMGIIGILSMIIAAAIAAYKYFNPMSEAAKLAAEQVENLTNKYKDLGEEMRLSGEARLKYSTGSQGAVNIGNMMQSADVKGIVKDLNTMAAMTDKSSSEFEKLKEKLEPVTKELVKVDGGFQDLADSLEHSTHIEEDQAKLLRALADGYAEVGQIISQLPDVIQKANQSFTKLSESMIKANPMDSFLANERQVLSGLGTQKKAAGDMAETRQKELEDKKNNYKTQQELDDEMFARAKGRPHLIEANRKRFQKIKDKHGEDSVEADMWRQGARGSGNFTGGYNEISGETIDPAKRIAEELAIAKLQTASLKEEREVNEVLEDRKARFEQFVDLRTSQVAIAKRNLRIDTAITNQTVLGLTWQGKLHNLQLEELKTKKGVVKAEGALAIARLTKKTQLEAGITFTKEENRIAAENVEFAEQQVRAQVAIAALASRHNAQKQRQVELEGKILNIKIAQVNAELEAKGAKARVSRETLLGGGGSASKGKIKKDLRAQYTAEMDAMDESIAAAKVERASRADDIFDEKAQLALKKPSSILAGMTEQDMLAAATSDAKAEDSGAAESRAIAKGAIQDKLDALDQEVGLYQKSLDTKRENAELDLQSFTMIKEHEAVMREVLRMRSESTIVLDEEVEAMKKAATETEDLARNKKNLDTMRDGLEKGFAGAFEGIITGAKSAKQAFLDMGKSMLAMLAKIIAQELALKAVKAIGGFLPFADGGIMPEYAKGGYTSPSRKYARGGTARGPQSGYNAVLHGNEAVVPLPDNRSIPVTLNGAGGQNNNVVVNVSMDGQGGGQAQTQGDSGQARAIGQMVASAVQQELQHQKRSGGILSPYGVS